MRIEVFPDPLDMFERGKHKLRKDFYVGPIMRLMQFRLKVMFPSTRSLKTLDDGV